MRALQGSLLLFLEERPVFLREQANKMYRPFVYFMAKNLADIPGTTISLIVFSCIFYFGCGYEYDRFGAYFGLMWLHCMTMQSMGLFIGCIFTDA